MMTKENILAVMAAFALAGCGSPKVPTAVPLDLYPLSSSFPTVQLLPPEQARPVRNAPNASRIGNISQSDWNAIVEIISRLPGLTDSDRVIVDVSCFGEPTVAVRIQLGGSYFATLVKTDRTTWKLAGIHSFTI
jgi:hypothetical protein